ncbi:hypothetical protein ACJVC5_07005 [Peredibacter sp. HCB2-198]|uniref:hypothetical protein n=1 Tax=Peredibacter sp. HCB2-198 TaxID=3383025 RepID=UPI0038B4C358
MRIAAVLMALVIVGCKSGGSDKVTTDSMTQVQYGRYTICENDTGSSAKSITTVTSTYLQEKLVFYDGTNCATGNEAYELNTIYSYSSMGSNNYRIRVESAMVTPYTSYYEGEFEWAGFCGSTNWSVKVPKNIIGVDCEGLQLNVGDEGDLKIGMAGANLRIVSSGNSLTYTSMNAMNFSDSNQSLLNGDYVYYDGTNGMYLTIGAPNYSVTFYDQLTRKYFMINGTFTTTGNDATFTVVSSTCPAYTNGETFNMKYSQLAGSLALRENGDPDLLLEKFFTGLNSSHYISAYLESGYINGCF